MDEKRIQEILSDFKAYPNKDLKAAMEFLSEDFEQTKDYVIKLTNHLDAIENAYTAVLKEYQNRK